MSSISRFNDMLPAFLSYSRLTSGDTSSDSFFRLQDNSMASSFGSIDVWFGLVSFVFKPLLLELLVISFVLLLSVEVEGLSGIFSFSLVV